MSVAQLPSHTSFSAAQASSRAATRNETARSVPAHDDGTQPTRPLFGDGYCRPSGLGQAATLQNLVSARAAVNSFHTRFTVGANDFRHEVKSVATMEEPLERFLGTVHETLVRELLELQGDGAGLQRQTVDSALASSHGAPARRRALEALADDKSFFKSRRQVKAGPAKTFKLVNRGPIQVDMEITPTVRQPRRNGTALPGFGLKFRVKTGTPGAVVRYTTTRHDGGNARHHRTTVHVADEHGHVVLPENNGNLRNRGNGANGYGIEILAPNGFAPMATLRLEQGAAPTDGQSRVRVMR